MTTMDEIAARGLTMLGCGRMGSAMLAGWLARGLPPEAVTVVDPAPSDWLGGTGVRLGAAPEEAAVVLLAVKPQVMAEALPAVAGRDALYLSVAAGWTIAAFEAALGDARIVRAMPNTPAAIGRGITALSANDAAGEAGLAAAETLLSAVGETVRVSESQMDAVTGVSGSGPAYVFHLIETLAQGGVAQGLDPELALRLARATVAGAGALAIESEEGPDVLRRNVTSPNGTTQAALEVLMDEGSGFPALLPRAVAAATARSKELSA